MEEVMQRTVNLRHRIVKLIAPKLYEDAQKVKMLRETPRPMITFISKHCNSSLIGAEIGVAKGLNAYSILQMLPVEKLYLIDPYVPYMQDGELITEYTNCYEEAKHRLKPFSSRIVWIVKTSDEAVAEIPDELDFVYIDGNHNYEFVKHDIENYFPKVKDGGILGGHDFQPGYQGVRIAVLEFIHKHSQEISSVHVERSDWWVVRCVH